MQTITSKTKLIMLITGGLTCTMAYTLFSPQAALTSMFGESLSGGGALAEIIVRSWGALITLVGAMLIYGAFNPQQRPLILTIAGLSKLIFVGLLVLLGSQYFPKTIVPIALDGIAVILYAICLLGARREATGAGPLGPDANLSRNVIS
jgi:predicted permease